MMKTLTYIFALLLISTSLWAANSIHYFDLKNRPADEVIPLLQPLLQDNESISGDGYQLFIKTNSHRVEEIESLITAIDRIIKTFRISVTSDEHIASKEDNLDASIKIESGDAEVNVGGFPRKKPGVTVNIDTRNTENNSEKTQFVQVQEGKPAHISRENLRITPIYSYVQRPNGNFLIEHNQFSSNAQDGFYVVARSADEKSANISIQSASSGRHSYQGYGQEQTYVDTTLQVPFGKWFEIGGNTESHTSESKGVLYRTKKKSQRHNKIFLKIELTR
jgi:hypothetical protein